MFPVSDASEHFLPVFVWVCSMSYKLKDIYRIGIVSDCESWCMLG